jgi:hypothetical protein
MSRWCEGFEIVDTFAVPRIAGLLGRWGAGGLPLSRKDQAAARLPGEPGMTLCGARRVAGERVRHNVKPRTPREAPVKPGLEALVAWPAGAPAPQWFPFPFPFPIPIPVPTRMLPRPLSLLLPLPLDLRYRIWRADYRRRRFS